MTKVELDPWRVLRSFLAKVNSRDVPDVIDRAGLRVDWDLSEKQDYSHSTRWATYRPRIDAAYESLPSDEDRLRVAFIVAGELATRRLGAEIDAALEQIGWKLRGNVLEAVSASVRELFFPEGSHHDAYVAIRSIVQCASTSTAIIDPYMDGSMFTLLNVCAKPGMAFRLLTSKHPQDFAFEAAKWRKQQTQNALEVRTTKEFHDRFIVLDSVRCWHIGASIKDAGNKVFMISQVEDCENRDALFRQIDKSWQNASTLS